MKNILVYLGTLISIVLSTTALLVLGVIIGLGTIVFSPLIALLTLGGEEDEIKP